MTSKANARQVAFAAGGGIAAVLLCAGLAQAITDTAFQYSTPKTGYYTISHMALAPDRTSSAQDFIIDWEAGVESVGARCFNTGVNLPNGATMTELLVYYETGSAGNPVIYFYRRRLTDNFNQLIGQFTSSDTSNSYIASAVPLIQARAGINNANFAYGFGACINGNSTVHSARIRYTYNNAGD